MLLALLIPVPGLLGGPLGGAPLRPMEPLLALRDIGSAARRGRPVSLWPSDWDGPGINSLTARCAIGGALPELIGLGALEREGTLETRGGPARGGGGVAVLASTASDPAFLLIQRFSSGSYTKDDASPSLARIAFG